MPGIGKNDPRVAVDPDLSPWRSLVRVQTNLGGRCTGVLVERNKILTAAHCLFNKRTQRDLPASSLHVLFGYDRGEYRAHSRVQAYRLGATVGAKADEGKLASERLAQDWAVLTLVDPAPADIAPLPLATDPLPTGQAVALAGFSQDKAQILTADTACRVTGAGQTPGGPLIIHDCAGTRGSSGAALLVREGGAPDGARNSWRVAGVAVAVTGNGARRNFAVPASVFASALRPAASKGQP